jgi:hypothetical protein
LRSLVLALVAAHLSAISGSVRADDPLVARTGMLEAGFTQGSISTLTVQGEPLVAPGGGDGLAGIVLAAGFADAGDGHGSVAAIEPGGRTQRDFAPASGPRQAHLVETVASEGGGLTVGLAAEWSVGGLAGVQWAIDAVPDALSILVPGDGGVRLDASSPKTTLTFDYPFSWEAPFVIIEGRRGGVLVRADEATDRYLRLTARRGRSGWTLLFTSLEQAPFAKCQRSQPARWRIEPFAGGSEASVESYRRTFVAPAFDAQPPPPEWTRSVRSVVLVPVDATVLEPLASKVEPGRTLLYVATWRRAGYDHDYPDVTGVDGLEEFVKQAHARGFHVMAHFNHFGCDLAGPECAPFLTQQAVDPWTHAPLGYQSPNDPKAHYAYIDPAAKAWRALFVSKVKGSVERYGFDAVHLDQLTLIVDDDRGPIDGASMLQGTRSLLFELRAALPSIALGGEEVNEPLAPFLAFAQKAARGVTPTQRTWSPGLIASVDPIEARLFGARVFAYAHPTCIDPATDPPYSQCLEVARRHDALPTVRLDAAALRAPSPALLAFFHAAAGAAVSALEMPSKDPNVVVRIADALRNAESGTIPDGGAGVTVNGPLWPGDDGAEFFAADDVVFAHPPYRAARRDPATGKIRRDGTGRTFASIAVRVPEAAGRVLFRSTVAVDPGAVGPGKTDGVAFEVAAVAEGVPSVSASALNADGKPVALDLDLTAFRGKSIRLRMTVDPGPRRNPSYDWARWYSPRVEIVPETTSPGGSGLLEH